MPDSAYIVTTDDGRLFQCVVEPVGSGQQLRWVFVDSNQVRYIGPAWAGVLLEPQVRALVNVWWETKKSLGQAGMNPEKLRDWLIDGR